ncbi:MAG: archease [Anaeromyxobacter sp.]
MRLALPQPHEDLGHTADVGVRVRGATAEEALARLALALGTLLAGGGPVPVVREERLEVAGEGATEVAVTLLRELLFRFATARLLPARSRCCGSTRAAPRCAWGWASGTRSGTPRGWT